MLKKQIPEIRCRENVESWSLFHALIPRYLSSCFHAPRGSPRCQKYMKANPPASVLSYQATSFYQIGPTWAHTAQLRSTGFLELPKARPKRGGTWDATKQSKSLCNRTGSSLAENRDKGLEETLTITEFSCNPGHISSAEDSSGKSSYVLGSLIFR